MSSQGAGGTVTGRLYGVGVGPGDPEPLPGPTGRGDVGGGEDETGDLHAAIMTRPGAPPATN